MSEKLATEDITVTNVNGQTVLVVAEGSPLPEDLDAAKALAVQGPIVQAVEPVVEDKAVRSPRQRKRG